MMRPHPLLIEFANYYSPNKFERVVDIFKWLSDQGATQDEAYTIIWELHRVYILSADGKMILRSIYNEYFIGPIIYDSFI